MEKYRPSAKFHESDRPCHKVLLAELDLWETYWLNKQKLSSRQLKSINFISLSKIKICLRILETWPVATYTCGRSFSSLGRLRNCTRSTMLLETLNGVALMHVHQDITHDTEKLTDLYPG